MEFGDRGWSVGLECWPSASNYTTLPHSIAPRPREPTQAPSLVIMIKSPPRPSRHAPLCQARHPLAAIAPVIAALILTACPDEGPRPPAADDLWAGIAPPSPADNDATYALRRSAAPRPIPDRRCDRPLQIPQDADPRLTPQLTTPDNHTPPTLAPPDPTTPHQASAPPHPALTFEAASCGPSRGLTLRCPARLIPTLHFSNPLAAQDLSPLITISPAPPEGFSPQIRGNQLALVGRWPPGQRLTLEIAPGLLDIHGQKLARPVRLNIAFDDLPPALDLSLGRRTLGVAPSLGPRTLTITTLNTPRATLRAATIQPEDLLAALDHLKNNHLPGWTPFPSNTAPTLVRALDEPTQSTRNILISHTIPFDALTRGAQTGTLILAVEAPPTRRQTSATANRPAQNPAQNPGHDTTQNPGRNPSHAPGHDQHGDPNHDPNHDPNKVLGNSPNSGPNHDPALASMRPTAPGATSPFAAAVIQITDIDLMVRYDAEEVFILATRLSTGAPIEGARLTLLDRQRRPLWRAVTDAQGFARQPGARALDLPGPYLLTATVDGDQAALLLDGHGARGFSHAYTGGPIAPPRATAVSVFTDRPSYRPGEQVHLKGIARLESPRAGIDPLPSAIKTLTVSIADAHGQPLIEGRPLQLSPFGTFSLSFTIPPTVAPGQIRLHGIIDAADADIEVRSFGHAITVDEAAAPGFEVEADLTQILHPLADTLKAEIRARYASGPPMQGAEVRWQVRRTPIRWAPPGFEGFTFAPASLGRHFDWRAFDGPLPHDLPEVVLEGQARLDARGKFELAEPLPSTWSDPNTGRVSPLEGIWTLTLEAVVTKGQGVHAFTSATSTLHPASFALGLKIDDPIPDAGTRLEVSAVALTHEGVGLPAQALEVELIEREPSGGEGVVSRCALTSGAEPVSCGLDLPRPGYFEVRLRGQDDQGRRVRAGQAVYVAGRGPVAWRQAVGEVGLVSDKAMFQPGEKARLLVKSPFERAMGLLTLERGGILSHRVVEIVGGASVLEIDIEARHAPNVHAALALVERRGSGVEGEDGGEGRARFAEGSLELPVDLASRRLRVEVEAGAVAPGQEATIKVRVTDAQGRPAASELAIFVVEGVELGAGGEPEGVSTPEPLEALFHTWDLGSVLEDLRASTIEGSAGPPQGVVGEDAGPVSPVDGRTSTPDAPSLEPLLEPSLDGAKVEAGGGGAADRLLRQASMDDHKTFSGSMAARAGGGGEEGGPPTALAALSVEADSGGRAEVRFRAPLRSTTWRVVAVAIDEGDRAGVGVGELVARRPVEIRAVLPRFAALGDRLEVVATVTNNSGEAARVGVGLRGVRFEHEGADRRQIDLGAGQSAEARFQIRFTSAGESTVQLVARASAGVDWVEVGLRVRAGEEEEAVVVNGEAEGAAACGVVAPGDVRPDYGGVEIDLAATALLGLRDAALRLDGGEAGEVELAAGRLLVRALQSELIDGRGGVDQGAALAALKRLLSMQRPDGGFQDGEPDLYASAFALWSLHIARGAGLPVPRDALGRCADAVERDFDRTLAHDHTLDRDLDPNLAHDRALDLGRALAHDRALSRELDRDPDRNLDRSLDLSLDLDRDLKHGRDLDRELDGRRADGERARAMAALALVMAQRGDLEDRLRGLYARRDALPIDARLLLLGAMGVSNKDLYANEINELQLNIRRLMREEGDAMRFDGGSLEVGGDQASGLSGATGAIGLWVWMQVDPGAAIVSGLMRGLMASRGEGGSWGGTAEDAWAIAAMTAWSDHYEREAPDLMARVWYGEGLVGQVRLRGRGVVGARVPMAFLQQVGDGDLLIAGEGRGRLYYRVSLVHAPEGARPALARGVGLERSLAPAAGQPLDAVVETREGWRVKQGALVEITLRATLTAQDAAIRGGAALGGRVAFLIDDPLSAGLEILDTRASAVAQGFDRAEPSGGSPGEDGGRSWLRRLERRDDRLLLFGDAPASGIVAHTILAVAARRGTFALPPARVEGAGGAAILGRTASRKLVIE